MCKVSVIVPVYNVAPYLHKCLDSIINQTLQDIEIICVNDCSTDNSLEILKEYSEKDSRIKLIDFKENKGVSAARNAGIKNAQGEYIGFVDSDDWIDLDFYEKLYTKAIKTGCDIVKAEMKIIDEVSKNNLNMPTFRNNMINQNILNFNCEFYTAIYKKVFLFKHNILFPEDVLTFEDPVFSINVILSNPTLSLISDYYYYRFRRKGSKTQSFEEHKINSFICGAQKIIELLNINNVKEKDYLDIYFDIILKNFIGRCMISGQTNQLMYSNYSKLYQKLTPSFKYKIKKFSNISELLTFSNQQIKKQQMQTIRYMREFNNKKKEIKNVTN